MSNNQDNNNNAGRLSDWDWAQLIKRIEDGKCTPFLGAGVNYGLLPLGATIARDWATTYQFPLRESHDLARVAQFLALTRERALPKELVQSMLEQRMRDLYRGPNPPDFTVPNHPLGVLAALPLPTYITTNYDDFMYRALRANRRRRAAVEICTWATYLKGMGSVVYPDLNDDRTVPRPAEFDFTESKFNSAPVFKPNADNPVVYHLHGHYSLIESMVLTENDYLDFLVNMSRDQKLLPGQITSALTSASLLFMGYSLADPNFRVLFRGLLHPMAETRRLSVAIQLRPSDLAQTDEGRDENFEERALNFLEKYFEDLKIKVFWGTAEEFAAELWRRWTTRPQRGGDGRD
ncbi:MAG TPA: SIR2 family protein [Pyrinomonadaceae bacterium]|jgi:hypothetical protein